jgi:hypothetical protein
MAALCKSNGKDNIETLGGTAWERNDICELAFTVQRDCEGSSLASFAKQFILLN